MAEEMEQGLLDEMIEAQAGDPGFRSPFDSYFSSQRPMFSLASRVWNPPTDVFETKEALFIKMEVAGLTAKDFHVTVENGHLIVRGCRPDASASRQTQYHHMEVRYGRFERAFALSRQINADAVEARYEQGFLIIRALKAPAPPSPLRVEVQVEAETS